MVYFGPVLACLDRHDAEVLPLANESLTGLAWRIDQLLTRL